MSKNIWKQDKYEKYKTVKLVNIALVIFFAAILVFGVLMFFTLRDSIDFSNTAMVWSLFSCIGIFGSSALYIAWTGR